MGRSSNGRRVGPHWRRVQGGVWVVAGVDEEGRADGEGVVVYPDMITVLKAKFVEGRMVEGRMATLVGLTRCLGLPWPHVQVVEEDQVFTYQPSSSTCISPTPFLRWRKRSWVSFMTGCLQRSIRREAGLCVSVSGGPVCTDNRQ